VRKINFIAFLFILFACREVDEFSNLRAGNCDIVIRGRYQGRPIYLPPGSEYEELIRPFRNRIEKNIDVLPMITRKFFFASSKLLYKFKFTSLDREKNLLILRYFARVVNHPIFAGYQIQFVFDIDSKRLIKIFTSEVPLE
jgi:hypothetical protein